MICSLADKFFPVALLFSCCVYCSLKLFLLLELYLFWLVSLLLTPELVGGIMLSCAYEDVVPPFLYDFIYVLIEEVSIDIRIADGNKAYAAVYVYLKESLFIVFCPTGFLAAETPINWLPAALCETI